MSEDFKRRLEVHQQKQAEIQNEDSREFLAERFRNVIRGAGYAEVAVSRIMAEHFDEYMKNIPDFKAMLKSYEDNDYDPD